MMLPGPVDKRSKAVFLAICADVAEGGLPPVVDGPDHDSVAKAIAAFHDRGGVIQRLSDGPDEIEEAG